VTFPLARSVIRSTSRLQDLTLTVLPHGGQRSARRNAWAAMSADAALARTRREAELAVAAAAARTDHPSAASS
jgi:hypothetical protein